MVEESPHIPVLYREVIDTFKSLEEGYIVDCTMGYAGHSAMLLEFNANISLIGIDQDQTAIDFSIKRLAPFGARARIVKGRFSAVFKSIVDEVGAENIRGILADIGVSSLQLDHEDRGFSYESDVLDMRMDKGAALSAADVVNDYSEAALADVLFNYGELRNARKLASVIVKNRPFHSAKALGEAVRPFMPKGKKIHPATLVMQAIRIEVNDELGELRRLLDAIEAACLKDATVAIISFHSLEDRIVKQRFVEWARRCICPNDAMRCTCGNNHDKGCILTKRPLTAEEDELKANSRSRSAKMRVFRMQCQ